MDRHVAEDDLILYYYGEGRRRDEIERHLDGCSACRAAYRSLTDTLALVVEPPMPQRDDEYGRVVWQRVRHRLPEQNGGWWRDLFTGHRLAFVGAAALIVIVAFVAGRMSLTRSSMPAAATVATSEDAVRERIRVATLGDHLERSERLLVDLANDQAGAIDITDEQTWASELIASNRLYREAALRAGDASSEAVLDELERSLLDVVHAPSKLTPEELTAIRARLEAAALLFKVRVLHDEIRERERSPKPSRNIT